MSHALTTAPSAAELVGLLAEPERLGEVAALALGAGTLAEVAAATGVAARDLAGALRRLQQAGLVSTEDGRLLLHSGLFKAAAQTAAAAEPEDFAGVPDGDVLRAFLRDGRLRDLPADPIQLRIVLGHVARTAFRPGESYAERTVNEQLEPWGSDPATLRRYLVDLGIMDRSGGRYQLVEPHPAA